MSHSQLLSILTICASSALLMSCAAEETSDTTQADSQNACAPALPFNAQNFNYYSTANNTLVASETTELEMIPDDLNSVGTAVFLNQSMTPPYTIEFEYTIFDDDGVSNLLFSTNSADGISIMLAKDESNYQVVEPPTGGALGFIDGDGYAVNLSIYGTRHMSITDAIGSELAYFQNFAPSVYPHGEWRRVRVTVENESIVVGYEGRAGFTENFLRYDGPLVHDYDRVAIGASTGGADGQHKIRNVRVCGA